MCRLLDFVEKGRVSLSHCNFLVLDEADRMLEEGFMADIEKSVTTGSMATVGERQTVMFSATFSDSVQEAAQAFLKDYLFVTVGMVGAICSDVELIFREVESSNKRETLEEILADEGRDPAERTMIFVGVSHLSLLYLAVHLTDFLCRKRPPLTT